jgi:hypothetical protein
MLNSSHIHNTGLLGVQGWNLLHPYDESEAMSHLQELNPYEEF